MLCSATDGDLPMHIRWFRNDIPLSGSVSSSLSGGSVHQRGSYGISITEIGDYESVLRIDNLRPEHNANFTCVAENDGGIAQHSQVLRVKGRQNKSHLKNLCSQEIHSPSHHQPKFAPASFSYRWKILDVSFF